jgi:hypothetical protein
VQDIIAPMFTGGSHSGISFSYNDATNHIDATVSASGITQEQSEDFTAALLAAGSHTGIGFTYNDATPSIDAALNTEYLQDLVAAMITGGTHTNLTATYQDASGTIDLAASGGGGGITQENAEDYAAALFTGGTHDGVSFTYNDATPSIDVVAKPVHAICIAVSDETTALTTGTGKTTFRMPYAMTLTAIRASVTTAPTGAHIIVDVNEAGSTIMTTNKLRIDTTTKSTVASGAAPALTDTSLADDAEITIDIDQVGSTIAGAGLKVYLIGRRT